MPGVGHGKVILLGEHSVVYGYPAIAAAIPRGATAVARASDHDHLAIHPSGISVTAQEDSLLAKAFSALLAVYPSGRPQLQVEVTSDLPHGAGLGSSAALGVAVVGAIDEILEIQRSPLQRGETSLAWERVFHGTPSGIDSMVSAGGGINFYRKGESLHPVRTSRPLPLVIAHGGEPGSTKTTVAQVARLHASEPDRIVGVFKGIEALVGNAQLAIEAGDLVGLGKLLDLNQNLLSSLLVSTSRLEELCAVAREAGALGAKLTGGGGGGCIIALVASEAASAPVVAALANIGAKAFFVEVQP